MATYVVRTMVEAAARLQDQTLPSAGKVVQLVFYNKLARRPLTTRCVASYIWQNCHQHVRIHYDWWRWLYPPKLRRVSPKKQVRPNESRFVHTYDIKPAGPWLTA